MDKKNGMESFKRDPRKEMGMSKNTRTCPRLLILRALHMRLLRQGTASACGVSATAAQKWRR